MSELLSIVEGWTDTIGPFTLKVDGTALNLTGYTVALQIRRPSGTVVTAGGTLTVSTQSGGTVGQVTYVPVAADFDWDATVDRTKQSHSVRFKVTDGNGKIVYFPNAEADEICVYRV